MTPDEVPELFAEGWRRDKPDGFLAYFGPLLHPETAFSQPLLADAHGIAEVQAMFRQAFTLLPDLATDPTRSAVSGDSVFIESDCTATVGHRTVHFRVCDRFVLRDGLIVRRHSFYDPGPLLMAGLRSPAAWPRALRAARRPR